jgi:predicted nucleic acid-binding protein
LVDTNVVSELSKIQCNPFVYDLTLLTRNVKDFEDIAGIKLLNPWEMIVG